MRITQLLALITFFICSQSCRSTEEINLENFNTYYTLGTLNKKQEKILSRKGFYESNIIYQRYIDKDNDGKLNKEVFVQHLRTLFPNKNESKMLILDWEGELYHTLKKGDINSPEFEASIDELIKLLKITKKERPKLRLGYYGFPFKMLRNTDEEWMERQNRLSRLIKEVDVVCPSVYDLKPDKHRVITQRNADYKYVKRTVELSLEMASEHNKPVIPFVWHRYHNSSKFNSLELIKLDEFEQHMKGIKDAEYNGKRASGVIWWGPDKDFHDKKKKALISEVNSHKSKRFDSFFLNVIEDYTDCLNRVFRNESK